MTGWWEAARPLLERVFEITAGGFDRLSPEENSEVARLCREAAAALDVRGERAPVACP